MALSSRTQVITPALLAGLLSFGLMLVDLSTTGNALADTLLVEGVSTAQATALERPARGSSMASVEARFGAPASRSGAVGQPPITRWEYGNFVVFFEYDHVVHSVRR